jgi:hypothetical protein
MITGPLLAFFHPEAPAKASHPAAAGLTFAERVVYQRAIEEIYWHHRIWPRSRGERHDPKPSFDAAMSQAQLEKKVADYLRESQALEDYWQRPITAEQLQVEMNRMAEHTKQPEVLRELIQALGNDPLVVAECLARPTLAERLFTSALAYQDVSWVVSRRTQSRKTDRPFPGYTLPAIPNALKPQGACFDAWGATGSHNAPYARAYHTAVWTGSEMIIWGGFGPPNFNTGGRYCAQASESITLEAPVIRQGGIRIVVLSWSPADDGSVNVLRDGVVVATTDDDGIVKDKLGTQTGTFTYQVCETDSGDCSNEATVRIRGAAD